MIKKIMIVDDSPELTFTVKTLLEESSGDEYEVTIADGGEKCLELLKNNKIPDIILLDIMMPEMDGWDVAAEIKKNPEWSNKIPIVFLTAKTDSDSKTYGKIVSTDYIEKPFEIEDLKERIDKILEQRKNG